MFLCIYLILQKPSSPNNAFALAWVYLSWVCRTQLSCSSDACTEMKTQRRKIFEFLCSVVHGNCILVRRGSVNQWVCDLIFEIKCRIRIPGLDYRDLGTWKQHWLGWWIHLIPHFWCPSMSCGKDVVFPKLVLSTTYF